MANNDPAPTVPTPGGPILSVAPFFWDAATGAFVSAQGSSTGGQGGITGQVAAAAYARPADATAYAVGDIIANSLTAASVIPLTFAAARAAGGSGRVTGARCLLWAASGTIVLPAFDLLLFRPEAGIPFAAAGYPADNAALSVSIAAFRHLIGVLNFSASGWRNTAGGVTASGPSIWQAAKVAGDRAYAPFNLASIPASQNLIGILQAQNTWTPGAVVNTFEFTLDVDQD